MKWGVDAGCMEAEKSQAGWDFASVFCEPCEPPPALGSQVLAAGGAPPARVVPRALVGSWL